MTKPKWSTNTPLADVTRRLHVLSLRLARIQLAQQAQRNLAMMKALAEKK